MATSDLYKLIQSKMESMDQTATSIAEKQKAGPTVEANLRQEVMGGDDLLNTLRGKYSQGVIDLFTHDVFKAKNYLSPEMQSKGMVADPMVGEKEGQSRFLSQASATQKDWENYEKRKTVLGDTIDNAMKLYQAGIEGDKTLLDAAAKQIDIAKDLMTEERLSRQSELQYGGSTTGDPEVDAMTNAEAIAMAAKLGYSFTGGTAAERAAKAKDALADYNKTGEFNYRFLTDSLGDTTLTKISDLIDIVNRADDLTTRLTNTGNLTGPIKGRTSSFLSQNLGISSTASQIGKDLEEMSADKIKERYGGALTETEVKRLVSQAITGKNVQETDNLQSLSTMKKNALTLIREKLKSYGWSDAQIEGYVKSLTGNAVASALTAGTTEPLTVNTGDWE